MLCEISKKFFEMLTAITSEQKIPVEYSEGLLLYHAETDLLQMIGENPGANVSLLSEKLGVTKSAVTQMSARLTEKGLIEKYMVDANRKERYFKLTTSGESVRKLHEEYHRDASARLRNYLCSLSPEEKITITGFMEAMKTYMPVCAFPCVCQNGKTPCLSRGYSPDGETGKCRPE